MRFNQWIVVAFSILTFNAAPVLADTTDTTGSVPQTTPAPAATPSTPSTPSTPATPAPSSSEPSTSTSTQPAETFQSVCVKSWMGRLKDVKDKIDFQNFGEKYCHCAESQQPLDNDEAINHAAQVCMSRTLLQDAVDNLRDDIGLSEVKPNDITEYCMDRWDLVYPNMDAENKKAATDYCNCANPKLLDLFKKSDALTDQSFFKSIDDVAAGCSGKTGK